MAKKHLYMKVLMGTFNNCNFTYNAGHDVIHLHQKQCKIAVTTGQCLSAVPT